MLVFRGRCCTIWGFWISISALDMYARGRVYVRTANGPLLVSVSVRIGNSKDQARLHSLESSEMPTGRAACLLSGKGFGQHGVVGKVLVVLWRSLPSRRNPPTRPRSGRRRRTWTRSLRRGISSRPVNVVLGQRKFCLGWGFSVGSNDTLGAWGVGVSVWGTGIEEDEG